MAYVLGTLMLTWFVFVMVHVFRALRAESQRVTYKSSQGLILPPPIPPHVKRESLIRANRHARRAAMAKARKAEST